MTSDELAADSSDAVNAEPETMVIEGKSVELNQDAKSEKFVYDINENPYLLICGIHFKQGKWKITSNSKQTESVGIGRYNAAKTKAEFTNASSHSLRSEESFTVELKNGDAVWPHDVITMDPVSLK